MKRHASTLCLAALVGCASQGTLTGKLEGPPAAGTVAFVWNSTDGRHDGVIGTALASGQAFTGKYHQFRAEELDGVDGWFAAWAEGFDDAPPFPEPWPYDAYDSAATLYSPKVIALLDGDRGTRMRCEFIVDRPAFGLAGGAHGRCQGNDGTIIDTALENPDS